jgi:hypothetical protein
MDRRLFVRLSAFSAAAISLSLFEGCQARSGEKYLATPDLLTHILEKEALADVGSAYLHQAPSEQGVDKLISLLLTEANVSQSSDEAAIKSFLLNKISEDFSTNKIVVVKGWILSVTEARQSALFYLLQK